MDMIQVIVCGIGNQRKPVNLCDTEEKLKEMTVLQLRKKIAASFDIKADDSMQMIVRDQRLDKNDSLLSSYGIQHLSIIFLVLMVDGGLAA